MASNPIDDMRMEYEIRQKGRYQWYWSVYSDQQGIYPIYLVAGVSFSEKRALRQIEKYSRKRKNVVERTEKRTSTTVKYRLDEIDKIFDHSKEVKHSSEGGAEDPTAFTSHPTPDSRTPNAFLGEFTKELPSYEVGHYPVESMESEIACGIPTPPPKRGVFFSPTI